MGTSEQYDREWKGKGIFEEQGQLVQRWIREYKDPALREGEARLRQVESLWLTGSREPLELTVILDQFWKFTAFCCIGEEIILTSVGGTLPDTKLGDNYSFFIARIILPTQARCRVCKRKHACREKPHSLPESQNQTNFLKQIVKKLSELPSKPWECVVSSIDL